MKKVVDASVAVKWFVPEIFETEATRLLESDVELHAPELILPEFSNIIWKKIRLRQVSNDIANEILGAFLRTPVTLHSHRHTALSALVGAVMSGQTVYDWTYLSLALALSCELVTADRHFYNALQSTSMRRHLIWIGDVGT